MTRNHVGIFAVVALSLLAYSAVGQRWGRECSVELDPEASAGFRKEWTFARLVYRSSGYRRGPGWDTDYPCAEQHLSDAISRLTRIEVQKGGQLVEPDSDKLFEYPWLYAVEVGAWSFSQPEAERMREYLLRGGFLMVDDFHGEEEWAEFAYGMRQIFPDRPILDVPADDPVYSAPFPIDERVQVPGPGFMRTGRMYEREPPRYTDGINPYWRGIRDDEGRWMVLISHNIDYGEGWEQADNPDYPEEFTGQAYEVAIDYLIYSMTH